MKGQPELEAQIKQLLAAVEEVRHLVLGANHSVERYPKANAVLNWTCPLRRKDCTKNCGNYGCGN
jgi:hypothetical protein